jgi:aminoglycoside 6-adenylyltransferase
MRTEKEIIDLILATAREDERIRAVVLSGSRADPDIPKDFFQDFDIVYLVADMAPFARNFGWIKHFGELMIMQTPDDMADPPPHKEDGSYTYLMQFIDGNRIDLGIVSIVNKARVLADNPHQILLDKDGVFADAPQPGVPEWRTPPNAKQFADCCNEFWWVCPYVAKGLWRGELVYAKHMMETNVREQLTKMLGWHVSVGSGFTKNPGKFGRFFEKHLEPELWQLLVKTYPGAEFDDIWQALYEMTKLFRKAATEVAGYLGFEYPTGDDERVGAHLKHVKSLPKKAKVLY